MKILSKVIVAAGVLLALAVTQRTEAEIVSIQWWGWEPVFVDVVANGPNATVWLRSEPWPTKTDIPVVQLHVNMMTMGQAGQLICRSKQYYDDGRAILGCLSVAGSAACAAGVAPSAGTDVAFCSAVWTYTASTGAADCVEGASQAIVSYLNSSAGAGWSAYSALAEVNQGTWTGLVEGSIDAACSGQ